MDRHETQSLAGLYVILTRPANVAKDIALELTVNGAKCISLPLIGIRPIDSPYVESVIMKAHQFDALVVTSANGLRAMERVYSKGGWPQTIPVCYCIGLSTARLARQYGWNVVEFSDVRTGESFGQHLVDIYKDRGIKRFLVVHSVQSERRVGELLRLAGHEVTSCEAYETVLLDADITYLEQNLPIDSTIVLTVFSPTAVYSWEKNLQRLPAAMSRRIHLACIGQTTAEACRNRGFHPEIIAQRPTTLSLRTAIETWWKQFQRGLLN